MSENPYDAPQQPGTAPGMATRPPSNAMPIISMILGLISLPCICCCGPFSAVPGLAAVICGFVALNQLKEGAEGEKGMAMAGLICGIIGIVLGIGLMILGIVINLSMPNFMDQMQMRMREMQMR